MQFEFTEGMGLSLEKEGLTTVLFKGSSIRNRE